MLKKKIFTILIPLLTLALVCVLSLSYAQEGSKDASIEEILRQFQAGQPQGSPVNQQQPGGSQPAPVFPPSQPIQTMPMPTPSGTGGVPVGVSSEDITGLPPISEDMDTVIDVLDLKNMDIRDFLKLISQRSGLNIIAGANVRGTVTIYLKDVDVRDALRIILEANALAYAEEDNIIKVMTAQEFELKYGFKFGADVDTVIIKLKHANVLDMVTILNQMKSITGKVIFDMKSNTLVLVDSPDKLEAMMDLVDQIDVAIETEVFDLSYADAKEVSEKLRETLTVNVGRLKSDERSNRIVITDTESKIEEVRNVIQAFDVKEKEVLIEAKILQIILSDQHQMGVDWEAIVSNYHQLNLKGDYDILTSTDKRGQVSIGTLSSDDYSFLLEALETVGETNILSSPSITALNNIEAKILVGSTQPYVTTTTTTPSSGPTTTAESVNFIDVGVKLFVTPTIHHDDYITMKIKPEVSTVTSNLTTSNNNVIPIVETSEAETTVRVKDRVTIVIGGLIKEEFISSVKKFPILGDIPFLGIAFRNEDKLIRKTELVIFLTPKVITGDVSEEHKLDAAKYDY